jgi:hypothetical protein
VLVDVQGTIIAGHGRVEAAKKLSLSEAPVMIASGWSEAKKRAYVIANNQLALNAGWNEGMLAAELSDLQELAFDLDLIGFDDKDLSRLLGSGEAVTEATTKVSGDFLRHLVAAVPYKIHTVLTDNGIHFTTPGSGGSAVPDIKLAIANAERFWAHSFELACAQNDIDHRLTKPKYPWTNG